MSTTNLSRAGRGRTSRQRIYVGCVPCAKGLRVADVEHANRWLESHWGVCARTEALSRSERLCRPPSTGLDLGVVSAVSAAEGR